MVVDNAQLFIFEGRACGLRAEAFEEGLALQNVGGRAGDGEPARDDAADF